MGPVVTTLAGGGTSGTDGTGTNAVFGFPTGVAFGRIGGTDTLFVADASLHLVRQIVVSSAVVTTLAGQASAGNFEAVGTNAKFQTPFSVTFFSEGFDLL